MKVVQWYKYTSQGVFYKPQLDDTSLVKTFDDCDGKKEPYDMSLGPVYYLPFSGSYQQRDLTYKICP